MKPIKWPFGTFLVVRADRAPALEILTQGELVIYSDRSRIAGDDTARRATFGASAVLALPAHSTECMRLMADAYTGAYETEVRGLCAAIALGLPTNDAPDYFEAPRDSGGGGGRTVDKPTPAPRKPSPGGRAALAELMASAA
jgi:hypothetical protein